jgi:Protein of unknown function (DUF3500)
MKKMTRRKLLKMGAVTGLAGLIGNQLPALAQNPDTNTTTALAEAMMNAATAFLSALDEAGQSKATYRFEDAERTRWHWTTPRNFPRNGLPLREMNDEQKALAFDLLKVSTSETGYQKALDIISLQNDLGNDPQLYFVTLFGTPGSDAPWGWRWEGHHLSRQYTVVGDQVVMFPFFLGSWPTITDAGLRAMPREEDAARELVTSLDEASRAIAIFQTNTLTRHITQNDTRVTPLDPIGIAYDALNPDQQALVLEIIQTYLSVLPEDIAAVHYARIVEAGFDAIRFGWAGELEPRRPHYYRLQGPTFLLEFDCSRNGGTHIHSVWRDFEQDFGDYLLG